MGLTRHRIGNRILDRLPREEASFLLSSAQVVALPQGRMVYRQDGPPLHVYFPTTVVFGVVIVIEDGRCIEGTTVGEEGMLGLPVFAGCDFLPFSVVVRIAGEAVQLPPARFLQAAKPGSALDQLLRRYMLYRLRFANQIGACNSMHPVEERLARWLLMAQDRTGQDELLLTHEFLSELLGVRRQTVSIVAGTLQRAGLITYHRGVLRVLDREGLEAATCECYAVIEQQYDRIMAS
jgi:CRP-like cAMP-binding protein